MELRYEVRRRFKDSSAGTKDAEMKRVKLEFTYHWKTFVAPPGQNHPKVVNCVSHPEANHTKDKHTLDLLHSTCLIQSKQ